MSTDPRLERVVLMAERLIEVLTADIAALERGRPGEMKTLDPEIQQLSAQYTREAAALNRSSIEAAPAALRARLTAATKRFREVLALHARILTRIRNASEGMIKAVAEEVDRRRRSTLPYSAPYAAKPAGYRPAANGAMLYNHIV